MISHFQALLLAANPPSGPVVTMGVLKELGFRPTKNGDEDVFYLKLGDSLLSAQEFQTPPVVTIWLRDLTGNSIFFDSLCDPPNRMDSKEEVLAWLAWYLFGPQDSPTHIAAPCEKDFATSVVPDWLFEGITHFDLLPWKIQDAEETARYKERKAQFDARAQCKVERDWLRLGLNKLREHLQTMPDDEVVEFSFDGQTLTIRSSAVSIPMSAIGGAWHQPVSLLARDLGEIPKRLKQDPVDVSHYGKMLLIDDRHFETIENSSEE